MKPIVISLVPVILFSIGCSTAEKQRQLQEYRQTANQVLQDRDIDEDMLSVAIQDPEFAQLGKIINEARYSGSKIRTPKFIGGIMPHYPLSKRIDWKEAHLRYAIVVGPGGNVSSAKYLSHPDLSVDEEFIEEGRKAVLTWVFHPGEVDGKPRSFPMIVPVSFTLR